MRYLANMTLAGLSLLTLAAFAPGFGVAQTGTGSAGNGPGNGMQAVEGGSILPAAAQMSGTKPIPVNELRSVLQLQKVRQPDAPLPERQLSSQERTELRQQLRHQRDPASASN